MSVLLPSYLMSYRYTYREGTPVVTNGVWMPVGFAISAVRHFGALRVR